MVWMAEVLHSRARVWIICILAESYQKILLSGNPPPFPALTPVVPLPATNTFWKTSQGAFSLAASREKEQNFVTQLSSKVRQAGECSVEALLLSREKQLWKQ